MIDYENMRKALKHLELQYDNYRNLDAAQPQLMQEAVAESVVQRFETCYDTTWKTLKRYLREELAVPEVPNSPKGIFRLAGENGLLSPDPGQWMKYAQARIGTSHDYGSRKVKKTLELTHDFIKDTIRLYQTMSETKWK